MAASTTLSPEQRTERARNAAAARTSVDHHIQKLADAAPQFTPQQIARLRAIFATAVNEVAAE